MTTRQEKVKELLKAEVSEILTRQLKDPRLGFITITDADISADMRHAKIYVSILGTDQEKEQNMGVLRKAEHFVRQNLAGRLRMKTLPEIEFKLDTSVDHGVRILELLEQIKQDEQNRDA